MHNMDVSAVLASVGLPVASATLLLSFYRRWLGVAGLYCHTVLFAVNLAILWDLDDSLWVFIPPAALVAAAGYFATGGSQRLAR